LFVVTLDVPEDGHDHAGCARVRALESATRDDDDDDDDDEYDG
jgi:hypothetical protein